MHTREPVKIPDIPGKISYTKVNEKEYVRYLTERPYNADRKFTEPERVVIGKRCESMPGLMYPNDNYEQFFPEGGGESMHETMTPKEQAFTEHNRIYEMYITFFDALFYEFKQQTRKRPDDRLNRCKAECLNKVLGPLKEMMAEEAYAILLRLVASDEEGGENGMNNSDVMMLLAQYKSALDKFRRSRL